GSALCSSLTTPGSASSGRRAGLGVAPTKEMRTALHRLILCAQSLTELLAQERPQQLCEDLLLLRAGVTGKIEGHHIGLFAGTALQAPIVLQVFGDVILADQ